MTGAEDCGCCDGLVDRTPQRVANRPGLNEIAYRAGTYATFRESMLAGLTRADRPALAGLRSRDPADPTIALIDAWAVAADVLTFYTERTANESYLGTATEQTSVAGIVGLIGYRLGAGIAAQTSLAFSLDTSPGSPTSVPIAIGTKVATLPGPGELPQTYETIEDLTAYADWNTLPIRRTVPRTPADGDRTLLLAGAITGLQRGDPLLLTGAANAAGFVVVRVAAVALDASDPVRPLTTVTLDTAIAGLAGAGTVGVHPLLQRAALFGYNAASPKLFVPDVKKALDDELTDNDAEWRFAVVESSALDLDAVYQGVTAGTPVLLTHGDDVALATVSKAGETSRTGYGISAKVTRLSVETSSDLAGFGTATRNTVVLLFGAELAVAEAPDDSPVQGDGIELAVALREPGQLPRPILLRGREFTAADPDGGPAVGEIALVTAVQGTTLQLAEPLARVYRHAVEIWGNVATGTHGESVAEVLGSGDAGVAYQQFTLRRPPLTQVQAATASGGRSTLRVRVNDIEWREVPALYGHGPRDRVFATRTDEEGRTVVQFGDGISGARPPTGRDNITASYRTGTGRDGLADAGQLSLLMTRPLGVRSVLNPLAATGAQDPEIAADAANHAPRTVLTLDRIVSLRDYADFAATFGGIGKAAATWTWDGVARGVVLTVSGVDGAEISSDSPLLTNLTAAVLAAGNPRVPLAIRPAEVGRFMLETQLVVDAGYDRLLVEDAARAALAEHFSFARRDFGQIVSLGEIDRVLHGVRGVLGAVVTRLHRSGEPAIRHPLLAARALLPGAPPPAVGAEVLVVDPTSLASGVTT